MDYKQTLNLPKTAFPMKADLANREPSILEAWEKDDNYGASISDKSKPAFILHDGPPYANGDIHTGHTLNKVLKDITVRYKSMRGFWAPYVPGWDCHGQPIDHQVEKKLKGKEVPADVFRRLCREYALEYVEKQGKEFKRLGVRGNFADPYLTLKPSYEAAIVRCFSEMYKKGLIYEGLKPVYWCAHDRTALAEAEIEYRDEPSPSIYVRFPLVSDFKPLAGTTGPKSVVIWTTTPWTLPANVAVAVNPEEVYAAIEAGGEILIVAKSLVDEVMDQAGLSVTRIAAEFKGADLAGMRLKHPILDKESTVVLADYVTLDTGTGCVHIAPGHGVEDYLVGQENDLPTVMPVDDTGTFTGEAGPYAGLEIFAANPKIIEGLRVEGLLLASGSLSHSYPHCWRCKNPVIFRATRQWFIGMETGGLRAKALDAIKTVKWIPAQGEKRITSMVTERPDWCISRQRTWGVPLPIFYCADCGDHVVTEPTLKAVESLFAAEGADAWYTKDAAQIVPPGTKCGACGSSDLKKGGDILDVWFESGASQEAVLKTRDDQKWPADLYLEGSDQHRGWFQSSLLISVGVEGKAPFKNVLTHGFIVDGQGRKMSKSLGNVISPLEFMAKHGADILRLWVSSGDYSSPNIPISDEIIDRIGESYRRIRNTVRFLMGNLADFDFKRDAVDYADRDDIDKWAARRLDSLIQDVTAAYDDYAYHDAYRALYSFCSVDMSAFYLDVMKDRLYTFAPDSPERRGTQTTMHEILVALTKLVGPILCFSAEEIWTALPEAAKDAASVHLGAWPEPVARPAAPGDDEWDRLIEVRDEVLKALEEARNTKEIGNALEAKVELYVKDDLYGLLTKRAETLPMLFIVSQVALHDADGPADTFASQNIKGLVIKIGKADGEKCPRCWNYSAGIGSDKEHPTLCPRCAQAVRAWPGIQ